ncbi:store-operated calcium entry-associated regulatory factor [Plakobranchus ocellatus]|uniref:Store-operated calcium entry-associated regulatory factor n=1 Tax=Plakobranchus ocellatus TaxID=259542 RepID=A0AAV3ZVE0_9GAST|nr:store-operated calcium entry-associated regulatory factor [Plakobranchus ocellatus]
MDSRSCHRSTLLSLIFTIIVTLTTAAFDSHHHSEKMLLSDVKALTLRQGQMTNSRRSSPVPQLNCVGGAAKHKFTPQVVQCINMGSDGYDIQWECKTDMDNAYRFGKVEVTCEGYDYPSDPYVLKGSCGLEYTIEFTEEGLRRERQKGGSDYQYSYNYKQSSEGGPSGLFVFAGVLLAIYIIYKTCIVPSARVDSQQPPPYGFRPEFTQPQGPPPPYDSWSTPDSNCGHTSFGGAPPNYGHHRHHPGGSDTGSGFWTGAATGGLLGYMFGSRNNHQTSYNTPNYRGNSGGFFTSHSGSPSPSSGSSGTRTASGFGGTSRR